MGQSPVASLLYYGGELYGKTEFGGAHESGIVFGFNPSTATGKVLVNLSKSLTDVGMMSDLAYYRGSLYATSFGNKTHHGGVIDKVNITYGHTSVVAGFPGDTSVEPYGLTAVSGLLYGTTIYGGTNGYGSLVSVNPVTRAVTTLYSFGPGDGHPGAVLTPANGMLYGVSSNNGVFAFNIATGVESPVATLDDSPQVGVVYQNGNLYGTATTFDGKDNGEIYRVDLKSGQVSVLY